MKSIIDRIKKKAVGKHLVNIYADGTIGDRGVITDIVIEKGPAMDHYVFHFDNGETFTGLIWTIDDLLHDGESRGETSVGCNSHGDSVLEYYTLKICKKGAKRRKGLKNFNNVTNLKKKMGDKELTE